MTRGHMPRRAGTGALLLLPSIRQPRPGCRGLHDADRPNMRGEGSSMSLAEILTLMTAATSAVVAIINALKHRSTAHKVDTTLDLMAQTQGTVQKVQALVNGQSEALRRALDAAQERCLALEAENAQLKGLSEHGPPHKTEFRCAADAG